MIQIILFIILFIQPTFSEYYCRYYSSNIYYFKSFSSSSCSSSYTTYLTSGSLTLSGSYSSYKIKYDMNNVGNDVYFGSQSSPLLAKEIEIDWDSSTSTYYKERHNGGTI